MKYVTRKISFLITLLFTLSSCEYKISDKKLESGAVTDNYRVYYEIFVGGFSDSNNDGMGDINGVIKRLDYLNDGKPNSGKSLGIDGIWLMPIMRSPSYHKYDVIDYLKIDPAYGTMEDFDNLIAECNERDIKLIIDLVINHTSVMHTWFANAKNAIREGNPDDAYAKYYTKETSRITGRTWYEFEKTPDGIQYYYEGNFSPSMPELDMDNPKVRDEIIDIVKFWLNKGVGGFRLDAVKFYYYGEDQKNIDFLKWLNDECKKIKNDVYIVAENWSGTTSIQNYYEGVNCFDFSFAGTSGYIYYAATGVDSVSEYAANLESYQRQVLKKSSSAILAPFVSNHDMDRAAGFLNPENYAMQMAANIYLLSSGCPFIYYGEEIGMKGSRGNEQTDANRRLAMLWGDNDKVKDPVGSTYEKSNQKNGTVKSQLPKKNSLFNHYKKLIMLRKANPEIAKGAVTALDFSDYAVFGGFVSDYGDSRVGVFHNTGEDEVTVDLKNYTSENFAVVRGYAGKGNAALKGTVLTLDGFTSVVLR